MTSPPSASSAASPTASPMAATPATAPPEPAVAATAAVRPGVPVYRWELRKLAAQRRTRALLGLLVLAPFVAQGFFSAQGALPKDTLFGRQLHDTGLALPLFVLAFASTYALPLLVSIVAGDLVGAEDRYGTWATVLTRSRTRGEVFTAKVLAAATWCVVVVVTLALASVLAGLLIVGDQPVDGTSGTQLAAGHATALTLLSWLSTLPAVLAFAAVALLVSVVTRSTAAGVAVPFVLGLVLGLVSNLGLHELDLVLLTAPLQGWHGLLADPSYTGPLLEGFLTSAVWLVVALAGAWALLRRRDEAGG